LEYVREHAAPTAKHGAWGRGFRNRREVVLKALTLVGLPRSLIYHGVKREVFMVPFATNTREFLSDQDRTLDNCVLSLNEITEYFRERWLLPRAKWDFRFRTFDRQAFALWNGK
jgi:hypothetical protein